MAKNIVGIAVSICLVFGMVTTVNAFDNPLDKLFKKNKSSKSGNMNKKGSKSSKKPKSEPGEELETNFIVYLTTGDILNGNDHKHGVGGLGSGSFNFVSNFDSVIKIKIPFLKYIDFHGVGVEELNAVLVDLKADRVVAKNGDIVTGTVVGFSGKNVVVSTEYGKQKLEVGQVKYIVFRPF